MTRNRRLSNIHCPLGQCRKVIVVSPSYLSWTNRVKHFGQLTIGIIGITTFLDFVMAFFFMVVLTLSMYSRQFRRGVAKHKKHLPVAYML
jgi:hypothetical protein